MKNPQTLAEELYKYFPTAELKSIKDYACCAFVLMWTLGVEPEDDLEAVFTVKRMLDAKVIKSDCTVIWEKAIKFLTGRSMRSVEFRDITVIKNLKERCPVRYDFNGNSHWVGVENGKIKFNPLKVSACVKFGKPATARIITLDVDKE
jgi:hypothetical protein